jgi:hypothetical protein
MRAEGETGRAGAQSEQRSSDYLLEQVIADNAKDAKAHAHAQHDEVLKRTGSG